MKLNLIPVGIALLCLSGCNSNQPTQNTDTVTYHPDTSSYKAVAGKPVTKAESFFETLDSLKTKIKAFDPSIGEFEDMPSDSIFFEAKDKFKNRIQVSGANNGIGELMWIWNHGYNDKITNSTIQKFGSFAKMTSKNEAKQWVLKELSKKATESKQILDTATINYNRLVFFNDGLTTISLKINIL